MAKVNIDMKKMVKKVMTPLKQKLIAIGYQIEGDAKILTPVDTGWLRASISTNWKGGVKASPDGVGVPTAKGDEFVVVVGTNVEYASHIEYGTIRGIRPRSMLRIALEKHMADIERLK